MTKDQYNKVQSIFQQLLEIPEADREKKLNELSSDSEIITEVKFAGLQQGDTASKNFITKQLAKIPIEFNVRIQAPFMQLMSSAKAYYEPEILVGQNLPALLRATEARAQEAVKEIKQVDE